MLGRLLVPASRIVRVHGQRSILARASVNTSSVTASRAGSSVSHHEHLTPRQEDEQTKTTMDFQHTPTGSWEVGLAETQAYYNTWLYAGVAMFLGTLVTGLLLKKDMFWLAPDFPRKNPPGFTMKQMEAEALAALEGSEEGGEEEEEEE